MDLNGTFDYDNATMNTSIDPVFMDSNLGKFLRIVCMAAHALSLVLLLLPYMLMDKVKGTVLARLMKSHCILSLVALFFTFIYTLMEYMIPATTAMCSVALYSSCYAFLGAVVSKVLFLFHIGYIFYNGHKMIPRDITDRQIIKLQVFYLLIITVVPLFIVLTIIIHNHLLTDVRFIFENRCLYNSGINKFTIRTLIVFVVYVHSMGILIIVILSFLLHKAYKTQKAVGQDSKNLFRIAVGIGVAFGLAWIVYAFQPFYLPVAPMVFYSTAAVENLVIISVFFYNNEMLVKVKMCVLNLRHHNHESDASHV